MSDKSYEQVATRIARENFIVMLKKNFGVDVTTAIEFSWSIDGD